MSAYFGDPASFAVEYHVRQVKPHMLGECRLWIESISVGSFDDENVLGATAHMLNRLLTKPARVDEEDLSKLSAAQLFDRCAIDDDLDDQLRFGLGEQFDDFFIKAFVGKESVYIAWKLHDDPFFAYPGYPTEAKSAAIRKDLYSSVVSQFTTFLKDLYERDIE